MKKRKHVRRLISLLLVMALMSTCLGVSSVSVAAENRTVPRKRGLCITGWHNTVQNDPDHQCELWFYHNVREMNRAFNQLFNRDDYSVEEWSEYYMDEGSAPSWNSCEPVLDKIHDVFDDSSSYDINYLYLTGHGYNYPDTPPYVTNCIHVGGLLDYSDLREELDTIPGHFIIFIQTCYAGQAIGRSESNVQDVDSADLVSYEEQIINSFFEGVEDETVNRSGELAGTAKYTVFCSSTQNQFSYAVDDTLYSYATYAWAKGLGWQINENTGVNGTSCAFAADTNGDQIVTAMELNAYTNSYLHDPQLGNLTVNQESARYYSKYYFRTIATEDYPLGDPSGNGDISNQDLLLIQKHIAGLVTLNNRQKKLADVNGSGSITGTDATFLQKYIAGVDLY